MGNSHKNLLVWNLRVAQLEPNFDKIAIGWSSSKNVSGDTRRFLWKFPIGSYVKLSSAVATILVGSMKCRTQFWKGTTQGSFQQSLVEIGSVVSEEKILFYPMGNSHTNLLFRNHWANCNQTLVEWSLGGPFPKLCPVILTSNQRGIISSKFCSY
jgi:hypothetical protein